MSQPRLANFVIGGTEKAGTTSVFDWLSSHPAVCASVRKETDFFREEFTGDLQRMPGVTRRFSSVAMRPTGAHGGVARLPGRSGHGRTPHAGPGARSESSFHPARPDRPTLFVVPLSSWQAEPAAGSHVRRLCEPLHRVRKAAEAPQELGLDEWYLKVLRFGCYADFIAIFRACAARRQYQVMFFEALRQDERRVHGRAEPASSGSIPASGRTSNFARAM